MTIQQIRMSLNESLTLKMFKKKQNRTYNCLFTWPGCLFLLCFFYILKGKKNKAMVPQYSFINTPEMAHIRASRKPTQASSDAIFVAVCVCMRG